MKVISILNQKGGSGKSTTAINLAVRFSIPNNKVLLIDTDAQGSILNWYEQVEYKNIDVVHMPKPGILRRQIKALRKDYDTIIVDGAPATDALAAVSIDLSDLIIIPMKPTGLDLWSTDKLRLKIELKIKAGGKMKYSYLLSQCPPSRTLLLTDIEESLGNDDISVFNNRIHNRTAYADSITQGSSIWNWHDKTARMEMEAFYYELMELING